MKIRAYAKINLGLRVLGKRKDGFHDIETIFHRVDSFDDISVETTDASISMTGEGHRIPLDEENLCWKAVALLREEIGTHKGARIHIRKQIPVGAGLGGGSSDAAAVLNALPVVWKTPVDAATLADVALRLGSDVPFFLHHRSAYAQGRGERLSFLTVPIPFWILVITPEIHISTAWAYSQLGVHEGQNGKAEIFYDGSHCRLSPLSTLMVNDFERPVFAVYPEIAELKKHLLASGATHALLSGSGSSVFGLFAEESASRNSQDRFGKNYSTSLTPPNFVPPL